MIVSILVLSVTVDHYLGLLTATGGVCCTRGAPPAMLRAPREKITTLLVLGRGGRTKAYPFRSGGIGYLTFGDVVRQGTGGKPSLIRSLADGWRDPCSDELDTHVYLVTEQLAPVNDHLSRNSDDRLSPDHSRAFIDRVLTPVRSGSIALGDISVGWNLALQRLREASGLEPDEFGDFLLALHLETGSGSGLPTYRPWRFTPKCRFSRLARSRHGFEEHAAGPGDRSRTDRPERIEAIVGILTRGRTCLSVVPSIGHESQRTPQGWRGGPSASACSPRWSATRVALQHAGGHP